MPYVRIDTSRRFSPEKMQKVGLFSTDHMFCDLYCLEPGQAQEVHAHTGADKIYVVIEGEGNFTLGDETHALRAGHVIHAPAGVPHGVDNQTDARLVTLVMMAPNPGSGSPRHHAPPPS